MYVGSIFNTFLLLICVLVNKKCWQLILEIDKKGTQVYLGKTWEKGPFEFVCSYSVVC